MRITKKIEQDVDVKTLRVQAGVRYWCDATVNGVEGADDNEDDDPGIPCREGGSWCPEIDVETGRITNWKQGTTARVHYKVCDAGVYRLIDADGNVVIEKDGYVPGCMAPGGSGYGDYIVMDINADGMIDKWEFDDSYFTDEDE